MWTENDKLCRITKGRQENRVSVLSHVSEDVDLRWKVGGRLVNFFLFISSHALLIRRNK